METARFKVIATLLQRIRPTLLAASCDSSAMLRGYHGSADQALLNRISNSEVFALGKDTKNIIEAFSGKIPSVTKVLKATQSVKAAQALHNWRQKMIANMGEEAFEKYAEELLTRGQCIHSSIYSHLLEEQDEVDPLARPYMLSVSAELDNIYDLQACEIHLTHNHLPYCGVIDCVAKHCSHKDLLVIDWKTSKHKKTTLQETFDHPLQIAAYAGLWNSNNPENQVGRGMLVMMYADGTACDLIHVNEKALDMYWQLWKNRLKQFWQSQTDAITQY